MTHKITIYDIILETLAKHDPMCIISIIDDKKEYSKVAIEIANRAKVYKDINIFALYIESVFDFWFKKNSVTTVECEDIAIDIMHILTESSKNIV
jgi:hypothetical protein